MSFQKEIPDLMYQKGRVWATLRKAMRFREGKGSLQVRKEGWRDIEGIAAIAGSELEAAAASWTGRLHSGARRRQLTLSKSKKWLSPRA